MKQKVSPSDVLDLLEKYEHITRAQVAEELDCSSATISKKVAKLIKDGENIGFDRQGLFIYNKSDMEVKENAETQLNWNRRIVTSLTGWAQRGNNNRPVLIEARRRFGKELTLDERKQLKSNLLMITRVVDAVNLDEELSS